MRARYDDQPHAHLAIAVQGPSCCSQESITLDVAKLIIGSWDRTYGAGKNLASKLASACDEHGAAHNFESFFHKYSDTSLWYVYVRVTSTQTPASGMCMYVLACVVCLLQNIVVQSSYSPSKTKIHGLFSRFSVTHPFNSPLSGTTQVSRYQKGNTSLDFTEARDSEWHQLGHMQVCISLQTDNHASTPLLSFLQAGCPSCHPTNSIKALKA